MFAKITITCPYCKITIHFPFIPYDFNGDFVHQEAEGECPNCGYPIRVTTTEMEKHLGPEQR